MLSDRPISLHLIRYLKWVIKSNFKKNFVNHSTVIKQPLGVANEKKLNTSLPFKVRFSLQRRRGCEQEKYSGALTKQPTISYEL